MQYSRCSTSLSGGDSRMSMSEWTPLLKTMLQSPDESMSSPMLRSPLLDTRIGEDEQRLVEVVVTLAVDEDDLVALDLAALLRTWPRTAPGPPVASRIWHALLRSLAWGKKASSALSRGIWRGSHATHKGPLTVQHPWQMQGRTSEHGDAEEEYGSVCTCAEGGAWRLGQESAEQALEV
ncbi:hypothetical protein GSI_00951 [Ganoderma sinense ZZ0214-1]|uniref:Uncharacterized protein n=1 Tax=Ganoderma sinense ZZ0214-1 TaxID=1077348 RepID=A0A2G8SUL0_9APHY|nr:hypothetical protein GSI_00951 [Ganoderma sinense ZZ0214-1]